MSTPDPQHTVSTPERTARTLPPWWVILLAALGIALAAFAIGRFSMFGASATPTTDSAEAGFSRDMQVHHTQAIEMSMTIYRKTEDEGVRALSYDIATAQAGQRGEFYDWLVQWGLPQSGGPLMEWMSQSESGHDHGSGSTGDEMTQEELMASMGMASSEELSALDAATGTAADCLFLELMIRHHEGAIPMAQALVELGSNDRAVQVAEGIIQTQSAEIDLMTSLRSNLTCTD